MISDTIAPNLWPNSLFYTTFSCSSGQSFLAYKRNCSDSVMLKVFITDDNCSLWYARSCKTYEGKLRGLINEIRKFVRKKTRFCMEDFDKESKYTTCKTSLLRQYPCLLMRAMPSGKGSPVRIMFRSLIKCLNVLRSRKYHLHELTYLLPDNLYIGESVR